MTAVARGAALYASTIDAHVNEDEIKQAATSDLVFLQVGYEATSVETSEWISVSIDKEKTGMNCPQEIMLEFERVDGAWRSDKTPVSIVGEVIEAYLLEGKPNTFKINAYDTQGNKIETFPTEFTIIQGVKVGAAPLPYNIGIAVYNEVKKRGVFIPAIGLEKNKPLPAVGVINNRKTTQDLRPGVVSDQLSIPVYQVAGLEAEGKTAALYNQIAHVVVTGDDVDQFIPENSNVDITLEVDSSEMMKMTVYFPSNDITVSKELDLNQRQSLEEAVTWVNKELYSTACSLQLLSDDDIDITSLNKELESIKDLVAKGNDPLRAQSNLKELLRKIETLEDSMEWERLESKLREEFTKLETAQNELGNDKTATIVSQLRIQVDEVIRTKDVKLGREVLDNITSLFVHLTMVYHCIALIRHYNSRFSEVRWKDTSHARQLINRGLEEMSDQPSKEKLQPIASAIINLLPDEEKNNAGGLMM